MPTRVIYYAEIDRLVSGGAIAPVTRFSVMERLEGGWSGYAQIDPAPGQSISVAEAFGIPTDYDLAPGKAIAIGFWMGPVGASADDTEPISLRTWPSQITEIGAAPKTPNNLDDGYVSTVLFSDPLTVLRGVQIWGVFKDCSPGEMVGGALSLATGGNGETTLTPVLPGMPAIRIVEVVREGALEVPYAIATGQPLGQWLDMVLARLGIRLEIIGLTSGALTLTLRDQTPGGAPVEMTLGVGGPSPGNAVIDKQVASYDIGSKAIMLDNLELGNLRRIGDNGAVEALISAAETTVDEAGVRATFGSDRSALGASDLRIRTGQPGLHPGRLVQFTDRPAYGADLWQVRAVLHGGTSGLYSNSVWLWKAGRAWRPEIPPSAGPITVSATVDDGESAPGVRVIRDRLGRIPVSFPFVPGPLEDADAGSGSGSGPGDHDVEGHSAGLPLSGRPTIRTPLTVAEPMAGGAHGFVPAHRQGDVCRVLVHQPMYAEIAGFVYGDERRVGATLADVSMGVIVRHSDTGWSGVLFRPGETVEEEEAEAAAHWRSTVMTGSGSDSSSEGSSDAGQE